MSIFVIDEKYEVELYGDIPQCKSFNGSIAELVKELENNKGYHQFFISKPNKYYTLYFDIDHVIHSENINGVDMSARGILYDIISDLSEYLEVDINNIYFTESKKSESEYSYHISIPSFNASLETIKTLVLDFKEITNFKKYIDDSVYNNHRWFRLPNQTNYEKPHEHKIIYGQMIDFLNFVIPNGSIPYELKKGKIKKKNEKKPKITKNLLKEKRFVKKLNDNFTDDEILEMLKQLDESYLNDYNRWSIITNMLKSMDKKEIWDKWSKGSDKYNKYKNEKIWRGNKKLIYDIRYLLAQLNEKPKLILHKKYFPITQAYKNIEKKEMNHYRLHDQDNKDILQYTYDDLNNNDTVILKSCTGTGKTTANAILLKQYLKENEDLRLLTIISRVSLGYQIINSFKEKDILIDDYKTKNFIFGNNYNVCLNSLQKLGDLTEDEISYYIVYIDEINSFIKHLTHNKTIDKDIKQICSILFKIIKYAHKVIVSDAEISDGVFLFLKNRLESKTIYIENKYKKYRGKEAIRIKDEHKFIKLLEDHIKTNNYFLFGCDSCSRVEQLYYYLRLKYDHNNLTEDEKEYAKDLIKEIKNKPKKDLKDSLFDDFITEYENQSSKLNNNEKSKFSLYTSNVSFKIVNASEEFLNKFIFYSPSIETAIDFSIDTPQDVFIYIRGNTIDASSSFQQLSRTRNIRKVYYFCEANDKIETFSNIEETKQIYDSYILQNDLLIKTCQYIDENNDIKLSKNSFYDLFIYNEYVADIYSTSRLKHFEDILKDNEFILNCEEEKKFISAEDNKELDSFRNKINEHLYNEYINSENKDEAKYNDINKIVELLNLPKDKEILTKYKSEIIDDKIRTEHFDIIRFFKTEEYIDIKIKEIETTSINVKCFKDIYHKIKLFRQIENNNNISIKDINFDFDQEFKCDNWDYIKNIFRTNKDKPENLKDFNSVYISLIKHITTKDIIESKQIRDDNDNKKRIYTFNETCINYHLELNKYSNPLQNNFNELYYGLLKIDPSKNTKNNDLMTTELDKDIFID